MTARLGTCPAGRCRRWSYPLQTGRLCGSTASRGAVGCCSSTRSPASRGWTCPAGGTGIPGARGCSQEACSFRDKLRELEEAGVEEVLALSSDRTRYQQELAVRLHLPYRLLSDPELRAADALALPTFTAQALPQDRGGPQRLYKRLTLVLDGLAIKQVFYPVFPPDRHADEVLDWVRSHPVTRPDARVADEGRRRGQGVS